MDVVVRTQELTRYYPMVRSDPIKAVDSAALELTAGTLSVVSGPSGSGKTTLLSLLAGLDRPNSGTVALFGRDIAELSDAALARLRRARVGLVFQDFKLLPGMPCWQNVALPLVPTGVTSEERCRRALEKLCQLGIENAADRPPEQLSGGQQQRVALARALVNEPDLILADEPTSQVDADSARRVLMALQTLSEQGKTVVITTHDPRLAADHAIRFHMTAGRLERLE